MAIPLGLFWASYSTGKGQLFSKRDSIFIQSLNHVTEPRQEFLLRPPTPINRSFFLYLAKQREMDPATVSRLYQIEIAIQRVANAKLQQEQLLALFWEHMPPIDPEERRMLAIQDSIRELDERHFLKKGMRSLCRGPRTTVGEMETRRSIRFK